MITTSISVNNSKKRETKTHLMLKVSLIQQGRHRMAEALVGHQGELASDGQQAQTMKPLLHCHYVANRDTCCSDNLNTASYMLQ